VKNKTALIMIGRFCLNWRLFLAAAFTAFLESFFRRFGIHAQLFQTFPYGHIQIALRKIAIAFVL
jgi:hypothetical protein